MNTDPLLSGEPKAKMKKLAGLGVIDVNDDTTLHASSMQVISCVYRYSA